MITFYYNLAPNPMKVALFLEETGLPYELKPVDTRKGEQHKPEFVAINPNAKVPVIIDQETGARVFDSNAILLYLAEKTGQFLPENTPVARGELLSWMMFVATGVGPFSGQAVHFKHFAPDPKEYAVTRYLYEAKRHYSILDQRLAERRYVLGESYTIVDMAAWGWARMVPYILGEEAWSTLPNLKRLLDEISARSAAERVAQRQGSTLTKEMILNHLYGGMDEPDSKIIDVFICKLRRKLAGASGGKNYIETVWGRGYMLREPQMEKLAS